MTPSCRFIHFSQRARLSHCLRWHCDYTRLPYHWQVILAACNLDCVGFEFHLAAFVNVTPSSTNAFLIKVDAVTGLTQWGTKYGAPTGTTDWLVVPTDVAADPVTGSVYIAGMRMTFVTCHRVRETHALLAVLQAPSLTPPSLSIATKMMQTVTAVRPSQHATTLSRTISHPATGVDLFNMGNVRTIGCPQDPRPVLSIKQCPVDTTPATTCAYGILNKERGLPYCQFVPLKLAASSTSGFIAAISEV